jgi:hypothetical protein
MNRRRYPIVILSPEDRESIVIALENLKQTIQAKLETATQSSKNLT